MKKMLEKNVYNKVPKGEPTKKKMPTKNNVLGGEILSRPWSGDSVPKKPSAIVPSKKEVPLKPNEKTAPVEPVLK